MVKSRCMEEPLRPGQQLSRVHPSKAEVKDARFSESKDGSFSGSFGLKWGESSSFASPLDLVEYQAAEMYMTIEIYLVFNT